ncbi:hypothetical protein Tco_0581208 [Tanacetum coccineum]
MLFNNSHHGDLEGKRASSNLIYLCLMNPTYKYKYKTSDPTPATPGNDGTPQQPREEVMETYATISEDIHKWITTEAEVVQIILTGTGNDIYSTVDACPNAIEMWKAIESLKQGESINVQDLKTN